MIDSPEVLRRETNMAIPELTDAVGSSGGVWGTIGGGIVVGAWFIDKFLTNRSGDNARVKALTEDNARLENRLREAEKRADENETHADDLAKQRNDLIREFAEIKAQYATVTERLEWLGKQNEQLIGQNATLVRQNQELNQRLNELLSRGTTP